MSIKDILVYLSGSPRSAAIINFAADVASRYSAHLIALYVIELPTPALFYGDPSGFVDPRLVDQMMTEFREKSMAEAARLTKQFRERTRRDGIDGEWRVVEGFTGETVALHARYADLTVLGQRNPADTSLAAASDVVGATLLSSGRPVLVLPYSVISRKLDGMFWWGGRARAKLRAPSMMPSRYCRVPIPSRCSRSIRSVASAATAMYLRRISRSTLRGTASKLLLPIPLPRRFPRAMHSSTMPATMARTSSSPGDTVTRERENWYSVGSREPCSIR